MAARTTRHQLSTSRALAGGCAVCGRGLSRPGRVTPIGVVGPECYRRVAAAPAYLEAAGLGDLAYGPMRVPLEPLPDGGWGLPKGVHELKRRAERAGLWLRVRPDFTTRPPVAELSLTPRNVRDLIRRLERFEARVLAGEAAPGEGVFL